MLFRSNIAPKEIEDCLRQHPAVADAYVYGFADPFFGEVVAAAVRLKPSCEATAGELVAWCAGVLAKFKVPKHVRFVTEFPMTASGKIQKFRLREEHERLAAETSKISTTEDTEERRTRKRSTSSRSNASRPPDRGHH